MTEQKNDSISAKAEAAFRQASFKVLERARQTGTPIIVWENERIREMSVEEAEAALHAKIEEDRANRKEDGH